MRQYVYYRFLYTSKIGQKNLSPNDFNIGFIICFSYIALFWDKNLPNLGSANPYIP